MGATAQALELHPGVSPVVLAGRDAWRRFCAAHELGLDQLLCVGRALLEGRRAAMLKAGANTPTGAPYIAAFRSWCAEAGFSEVPTNWRMDLTWCAEHETEVRAAWGAHLAARAKGRPSLNPRTLRQSVTKIRKEGPPRKRKAPTVAAMPIETLCVSLGRRLAALDPHCALGEIARLASTLETATISARKNSR
ncbi:hypothetical protein [Pukyongiella litopenaei]|nr:hypothetical protein [Pukyongiella litopenaei]